MTWVYLFFAGLFEVGWAVGLKFTAGFTRLVPSLLTLAMLRGSPVPVPRPAANGPG